MDIIVTTPKSRMADAAEEARVARDDIEAGRDVEYFRSLGLNRPARLNLGDRIYYVEDGWVRGFCIVRTILYDPTRVRTCSVTGREYGPGCTVFMDPRSWQWIAPIPMRGFQGWQYFHMKQSQIDVIGGWRDPKPEVC